MDETSLRAMFERAVAERPPAPRLVPDSLRAGVKLRKRRRIEAAAGSIAAVALIAAIVPAAAGAFSRVAEPPAATAGSAGAKTAFVWTGNDTVTPVRLNTGKVLAAVTVPNIIQNIVAAPDGKTVYVFSNSESNSSPLVNYVTAIDSATGKGSRPVKLAGTSSVSFIADIQVAPDGKAAYASEEGTWPADGKNAGTALVQINLATGAQRVLTHAGGRWQITPGGRTAYSAGSNGEVDVFDLTSGTLLPPIKLGVPWSRSDLFDIAVAPGGRTLWALSVLTATPARSAQVWVTPISTTTDIAASPIEVRTMAGGLLPQIVVAPDGQTGYVDTGRYLYPVSLAAGQALTPIVLPSVFAQYFSSLSFSPDSKFAEEYQPRSTTVQVINFSSASLPRPAALPGGYRQSSPGIFAGGSVVYVPASIFRGALPSFGAFFPVDLTTGKVGNPILFSGVPNGAVIVG